MKTSQLVELENEVLLKTYARPPVVMSHGVGARLYDITGRSYLDFIAGIAVNGLGYGDQDVLDALKKQAEKIWHVSNLYHTEPQILLAKALVDYTFADRVFFCNSGTEAIEGAIKLARKWSRQKTGRKQVEILAFKDSFHGRSYGGLSATGQPKFWEDFEPMLPGFNHATFNDMDSVKTVWNENTAAVLLEPIQGEGGIFPAEKHFLQELRQWCDEHQALLIFDEIQCGLGRTGYFCAHDYYGITPDIMTLAKPLAAGLPMGAILMTEQVAEPISVGHHGSTFGGGPLVCQVARTVLSKLSNPTLLQNVKNMGAFLVKAIKAKNLPPVQAIRGRGLMVGVQVDADPGTVVKKCFDNGLLIGIAGNQTLRFVPPLVVQQSDIEQAVDIFSMALSD